MNTYSDQLCGRCGSTKMVSKSHQEVFDTNFGTSKVEVSQISCTNTECQTLFEKNLAEAIIKAKALKEKKLEDDVKRRENMMNNMAEARKNKKITQI